MNPNRKLTTRTGKRLGLKLATLCGATLATVTTAQAQLIGFGPDDLLVKGDSGGVSQVGSAWTVNPNMCCSGNSVQIVSSTSTLILGGGGGYNAGSAFANTTQNASSGWTSTFTFNQAAQTTGQQVAWAFVIQNDSRGTVAKDNMFSGYVGGGAPIGPALEVVFSNGGSGQLDLGFLNNTSTSPQSGFQATTAFTGLDFTAGLITANLSYSGTTLTVNLTQTVDGTMNSYSATDTVNIPALLGQSNGYVGFDANRMDDGVTVTNFSFTPAAVPEPRSISYAAMSVLALLAVMRFRKKSAV